MFSLRGLASFEVARFILAGSACRDGKRAGFSVPCRQVWCVPLPMIPKQGRSVSSSSTRRVVGCCLGCRRIACSSSRSKDAVAAAEAPAVAVAGAVAAAGVVGPHSSQ